MFESYPGVIFFSFFGMHKFSLSIEYSIFFLNIDDFQGSLIANTKSGQQRRIHSYLYPAYPFLYAGDAPNEVPLRLVMTGSNNTKFE